MSKENYGMGVFYNICFVRYVAGITFILFYWHNVVNGCKFLSFIYSHLTLAISFTYGCSFRIAIKVQFKFFFFVLFFPFILKS